jgi:selenocysteine-specific elongation factor
MPYVIGTAGHIDHGKTSLIKALTGQDTDRLKEEKERGISIDLGFAHLEFPDGTQAGIVDVPGHERFIRNMLAGAHGMDLVLFTVAADDGVMPQTEEHLDILHLLGIQRVIFIITKKDLVEPPRLKEVEEEIAILTLGTSMEDSPVLALSSATGEGIEELRARIFELLGSMQKPSPPGYFRLPVDRAFVLQGHGIVVTGTALSGQIAAGDRVRSLPGGEIFRVRSLQVHGRPVERAGWGQRIALNLTGQERAAISRGDVICHEKLTAATERFDALLEVRPAAVKGVKNHQRVRIHLGTAERLGKLIVLENKEKVNPKETAMCQVTVSEPLLALRRDRFIMRDETGRRTLGGGIVLHPWAVRHKRAEAGLSERLRSLQSDDSGPLIQSLIDGSEDFVLFPDSIYQFLNRTEEEGRSLLDGLAGIRVLSPEGERVYTTEKKWQGLGDAVHALLESFHAACPLAAGMDMEELRAKLPHRVSSRLFRYVVDLFAADGRVRREENLLRLPDHQVHLHGEEKALMEKIQALLGENPLAPPDLKQIESALGANRAKLGEVIRVMEREKRVARVAGDLYFLTECVDKVKGVLYSYLKENGDITAAAFRDLLGSSRKYTIALLEYFDREGLTIRIGDLRRLKAEKTPAHH